MPIELVTNPNIVFLLLTLGCYGLIYEMVSPGMFLPGATGAILLLLGFFTMNNMAVEYYGVFLIIMGTGLMMAEAFYPKRGLLGITGAISFAAGGVLFLNHQVDPWLVAGMTVVSFGLLSLWMKDILRSRKAAVTTGAEGLKNSNGEIVHWSHSKGEVLAAGSVWKARSEGSLHLKRGDHVKIVDIDGLCLIIKTLN